MAQQLDKALGTTDIDPVLGKIKAAKTPQETIDIGADITKGGYEADVAKIRAEQRKAEKLPAIERQLREEEGKYLTGAQERERKAIDEAEMAMQNFKVSKETPYGMAALASVIGVLGQIAGRTGGNQAALGAIKSMTGMMQGYQQGRADIFRREQIEFDKNFKIMQNKIDKARKEFDRAVALMPYNMAKAREVAEVAKAELNSPIVNALVQKQGFVAAQTLLTQASNSIQKEEDRALKLALSEAKEGKLSPKVEAELNTNIVLASNLSSLSQMVDYVGKTEPLAFGPVVGQVPGLISQKYLSNRAKQTKALMADLMTKRLKDRSGATVTVQEWGRAQPFIVTDKDDPETIQSKIRSLYDIIVEETQLYAERFKEGQAFKQRLTTIPQPLQPSFRRDVEEPSVAEKPKQLTSAEIDDLRSKAKAKIAKDPDTKDRVEKRFKELTGKEL